MRVLFALVLATLALAGCNGVDAPARSPSPAATTVPDAIIIRAGQPIVVGVSAALSGDQMSLGADIAAAAELAVANAGGSIEGHAVQVAPTDDRCSDAEAAVAAARALIAESGLVGVIGPMCTTGAQAANRIYEQARAIHVAVSVTRAELSAQGERYFFRTSWRDDAQARMQASYAFAAGATTAFIIDDGSPYGRGLAEEFAAAYTELGGRVSTRERIASGTTDFSGLARQVRAAAPGAVVFQGLNPEASLLVQALRDEEYTGTFMAPDSVLSVRDFLAPAQTAAELAVITGGAVPDEAFNTQFNDRFQRQPATPFVLQSHDAVTALLAAVRAVARNDAEDTLTIDRDQLAEAMRSQVVQGLTGPITFDERGDRSGTTARDLGLRIYRVTNGQFVPID